VQRPGPEVPREPDLAERVVEQAIDRQHLRPHAKIAQSVRSAGRSVKIRNGPGCDRVRLLGAHDAETSRLRGYEGDSVRPTLLQVAVAGPERLGKLVAVDIRRRASGVARDRRRDRSRGDATVQTRTRRPRSRGSASDAPRSDDRRRDHGDRPPTKRSADPRQPQTAEHTKNTPMPTGRAGRV